MHYVARGRVARVTALGHASRVSAPISLSAANTLDPPSFVAAFGSIYEHAPWVAEAVLAQRPFASVAALGAAMAAAVAAQPVERRTALLRAHPDLATTAPLTAASAAEQTALGLDRLDDAEAAAFAAENAAYRARFGIPFIIAVRGQRDRAAIRAALAQRMGNTPEEEMAAALAQVDQIAQYRLEDRVHD